MESKFIVGLSEISNGAAYGPGIFRGHERLEPTTQLAVYSVPKEATPVFVLSSAHLYVMDRIRNGEDPLNLFGIAGSGNSVAITTQQLNEHSVTYVTRAEEYTALSENRDLSETSVLGIQIGNAFYNDGSGLFVRDYVPFVTPDTLVASRFPCSPLYGERSLFTGYYVGSDGLMKFGACRLDVRSQEQLDISVQREFKGIQKFIGTGPLLVVDGQALSLPELLTINKISDPRHFFYLAYWGGLEHGEYGNRVEGPVLLGELMKLFRAGHGMDLYKSLISAQPLEITITEETHTLIASILRSKEAAVRDAGIADLKLSGIAVDNLVGDLVRGVVRYTPKLGFYPHTVCGDDENGNPRFMVSSGLLDFKISANSGVRVDMLGPLAIQHGFRNAAMSNQGRDTLQIMEDGEVSTSRWLHGFTDNATIAKAMLKYATTFSTQILVPHQRNWRIWR